MATLLKGGKVLLHDDHEHVNTVTAAILVDGPHEILDCTNKIVSPGFVDTHHHWKLRKWDGKLLPTQVEKPTGVLAGYTPPVQGELTWAALADKVIESRARIMPLVKKIDMPKSCDDVVNAFYLNREGLLDPVTD